MIKIYASALRFTAYLESAAGLGMSPTLNVKDWTPARFTLRGSDHHISGKPFATIVLNQPLENETLFRNICRRSNIVVAADGGANRILDMENAGDPSRVDVICGDLDSIRPDVREYFAGRGVKILLDADQYSTDLTKCLRYIRKEALTSTDCEETGNGPNSGSQKEHLDVAIFGGLGGRADQAFSQLHHLYVHAQEEPTVSKGDLYLITPESVVFLLEKGLDKIHTPLKTGFFKENVGIIPIAKPSVITTRGLEWDVTDWPTEFGIQISTSNHIKSDLIEVETTERVLFTLELDLSMAP